MAKYSLRFHYRIMRMDFFIRLKWEQLHRMKPQLEVNANHKPQIIRTGIHSHYAQSWKHSDIL